MWYEANMQSQGTFERNAERHAPDLRTQTLLGAAALGVPLVIGLALWARFGDAVYVERLLSMIASCI